MVTYPLLLALGLVLFGSCLPTSFAEETPKDDANPEKVLRDAQIATDTPSLIQFLRIRTLTDQDRKRLYSLIRRLGDRDFDVRQDASEQLEKASLAALPMLRGASLNPDPEVSRRVERILARIDQQRETGLITAVIQILLTRKDADTLPVVLNYLPSVPDDEPIVDEVRDLLVEYTRKQGKAHPDLKKLLTSPEEARRRLAGQILGEALPSERTEVRKLLTDPSASLRFAIVIALIRGGDRDTVPSLISFIGQGPIEYAYQAEDILCRLNGSDSSPPAILSPAIVDSRKSCQLAWEKWWKEKGAAIDFALLNKLQPMRGLTIILEVDGGGTEGGRVWECGPDGKQRWEMANVKGPVDIQLLPGGKFLLAEYYASRVTERDREGKILWESPRLSGNVVAAQRLRNGNTLVATMSEVFELNREGKRDGEFGRYNTTVFHVRRNVKGQTFVQVGNEIIEYDASRKQVRKFSVGNHSGWSGFELLPNGHFLVAGYSRAGYAEYDSSGKQLWEHVTGMGGTRLEPTRIQRLPNGNILVAGGNVSMVAEFDVNKKEVWKVNTKGRPFAALRY